MKRLLILLLSVLVLAVACGDGDDSDKKNDGAECSANGDCREFEICDVSAGRCVVFVGNNENNLNNENNENNTNNTSA